jgi:Na+/glutamate symporter
MADMDTRFRGSQTARRIGAVVLALLILGYLVGITYWRLEDLRLQRSLAVLIALSALGILALALLARAWRHR